MDNRKKEKALNNKTAKRSFKEILSRKQTTGEEIANSITHGVGALLSIVGLVLLVVFASKYGDAWRVASLAVYGTTLVLLYTFSTLYHSFPWPRVKRIFRIFDHSSIFLLIAGTYTPVLLIEAQIARAHRETVVLPDDWTRAYVDGNVEIGHHTAHDEVLPGRPRSP